MRHSDLFGLNDPGVWDTESAFVQLQRAGQADSKRTAERRLHELQLIPAALSQDELVDDAGQKPIRAVLEFELDRQRSKRKLVLFAQLRTMPDDSVFVHANDARGARYWVPLGPKPSPDDICGSLQQLQGYLNRPIAVFPHGDLVRVLRGSACLYENVTIHLLGYREPLKIADERKVPREKCDYLTSLEAESIFIIREALSEAENPAILYSIGKDSSVLLHLARKAFYPAKVPLPLLHVDTRWKFHEMYQFRDHIASTSGMNLIVHINQEAIEQNINPFDHGAAYHTRITKTEGLKQALEKYKFDVVLGGARRDEERSRAKERVFSFRSDKHAWDPRNQRPELWSLYNTRKADGESIRVFPLSNWTELDVWQYIRQEEIPLVPLYFAKERPVVVRDGIILAVDDDRMRLAPGEKISLQTVRFRTLGCYPLTGAIPSNATDVEGIILELRSAQYSERQGRLIDAGSTSSMEKKKIEGYF